MFFCFPFCHPTHPKNQKRAVMSRVKPCHESRCSFDIEFQNGLMSGRELFSPRFFHGVSLGGNIPQHLRCAVFYEDLLGELIGKNVLVLIQIVFAQMFKKHMYHH